jgi:hypothetical protein
VGRFAEGAGSCQAKNAVSKVSGACTLSQNRIHLFAIRSPACSRPVGFDRCLWGTDWTRAYAVVNYEQAVEPFLQTDRLSNSERAADGRRVRQSLSLVAEKKRKCEVKIAISLLAIYRL